MSDQSPIQESNTTQAAAPEAAVAPPENPVRRNPVADLIARASLTQLTMAVIVAIFLWQWLAGQAAISGMRRELAEKIAEMDGNSKANQIMLEHSQGQVRELSAKVAALEARSAESQNQRAALEALYNDLSVSRDETALAEVEQMLMIAGQQLQLSGNVKAALIAMQSADARLERMNRPAFNGLRKTIAQDMAKLRALPNIDLAGIGDQLNGLMGAVDGLPLLYRQRVVERMPEPVPADESSWQRLLHEVWHDVSRLVRIENTGKSEIPMLPPEQEFFLRENLKLRFLSARLALLSRDETAFSQELKTAQSWIARYFDVKSGEGAAMLGVVRKLAASHINIELPDISSSLQAVRGYRLTRPGAAERIQTGAGR